MSVLMEIIALSSDQASDKLSTQSKVDAFLDRHLGQAREIGSNSNVGPAGVEVFDLASSWPIIDFSLGEVIGEPDETPLMSGTPIGSDRGFGRPVLHSSQDVKVLALALANNADDERLLHSEIFRKEILAPGEWEKWDNKMQASFLSTMRSLRNFIAKAAKQNKTLLVAVY